MKKWVLFLAAAVLSVSFMILPAGAAEIVDSGTCGMVTYDSVYGSDGSDMTWTLDSDGKVVIQMTSSEVGYMEQFRFRTDGDSPWAYNEQITSVEIREGVKSVGTFAFMGCSNLKSVTFPKSLTSISMAAFAGCTSLEQISLPAPISIQNGAFTSCKSLTSVAISYSEDLDKCFSDCGNIRNILYNGNESSWKRAGGEKLLAAQEGDVQLTFKPRTASGTCSIAEDSDLKWTVNEDGELRIYGNGSIDRSYKPNTWDPIPFGWETYCTEVDRIVIEPGVTSIGDFRDLWAVESIYIPTSVTEITAGCFPSADRKTTVYYAGTEAQWNKINIDKDPPYFTWINHGRNDGLDSCTFVYNYPVPVTVRFTDVPDTSYCANSVRWAIEHSITQGTGNNTFSPNKVCTNSEILTFLWRASGSPEPTIDSPYTNIHAGFGYDAYYYKAALWSYEKKIYPGDIWTDRYGESNISFSINKPCTRRDTVVYLWKAAGSPKGYSSNFSDVNKSDTEAVQAIGWAAAQGITNGVGNGFAPDKICSRGEIVTFLQRALG